MSEENVLSIKAQVYYLDQVSQNWSPATFTVIPVGFWYEAPPANRTRIIALENDEVRINSIVSPGMTFSRMSETFGQWHDPITSQFYGLNFMSTADTEQFEQFFVDATEDKRPGSGKPAGTAAAEPAAAAAPAVAETSEVTGNLAESQAAFNRTINEKNQQLADAHNQISALQNENESLKNQVAALKGEVNKSASGSTDVIKRLSDDIAKLKEALRASSTHVEEWKAQIAEYEYENGALHAKIAQMNEVQRSVQALLGQR